MGILSKVSYMKMYLLSMRIELRSTLYVLGIVSDQKAIERNKKDLLKAIECTRNLDASDRKRLHKYAQKAEKRI